MPSYRAGGHVLAAGSMALPGRRESVGGCVQLRAEENRSSNLADPELLKNNHGRSSASVQNENTNARLPALCDDVPTLCGVRASKLTLVLVQVQKVPAL